MKGFNKKEDINFNEIFFLDMKMSSVKVALDLATSLNLKFEQLDIKTSFLHDDLKEEICIV